MRNHEIRWTSTITLLILVSVFGSSNVLGQGGTGRNTGSAATSKPSVPNNKRSARPAKSSGTRTSEFESKYVPVGPTADAFIFIKDMLNAGGVITDFTEEPKKAGAIQDKYQFIPVDQCKATIIGEHKNKEYSFIDAFTFSFSDLDPSKLPGWSVLRIPTANGDRFVSSIYLQTPNNRNAILQRQKNDSDPFRDLPPTSIFFFVFYDNENGDDQVRLIKAVKSAIESCGGKPSPF